MNGSGAGGRRPRSLKARALQLLAQRDQSRTELRRNYGEFLAGRIGPAAGSDRAGVLGFDRIGGPPLVMA